MTFLALRPRQHNVWRAEPALACPHVA
jgi:hypothetical protein